MKFLLRALMIYLLSSAVLSHANAIDVHQFDSSDQEQRYRQFIDELRCPKCQNQNLSGSNSPIAQDLRRELFRMVQSGEDDQAIKRFMVQRYGNFVLYEPPMDNNTFLLWMAPLILFILALLMILVLRIRHNQQGQPQPLSDLERQQLADILDQG
ncbi:MAG: cytochrome c-type biogenesis protein CcmH [Pseudomonadales bacterium]|nr:cytochrome c-type biogenesis protein CcmH [Pseudomonadales bacterium]